MLLDPCTGHKCGEEEICKLHPITRQPYCDCAPDTACHGAGAFQPHTVCGSDGNSYLNRCVLRRHACLNGRNVSIASDGECAKGTHSCHRLHCNAPSECVADASGRVECECRANCFPIYKPVCGSDGRTYDSGCHLAVEACRRGNSQPRLGVASHGACKLSRSRGLSVISSPKIPVIMETTVSSENNPNIEKKHNKDASGLTTGKDGAYRLIENRGNRPSGNLCDGHRCSPYSRCVRTRCECPVCSANSSTKISTVCGSDRHSYANECEMRKAACEHGQSVHVKHRGVCSK